ncbi:MAG TPA: hypothetical protein PKE55_03560 [Kiritimatiellia bacterium]|nr:hypothetical protein [Kiritimatiellia bacterium]
MTLVSPGPVREASRWLSVAAVAVAVLLHAGWWALATRTVSPAPMAGPGFRTELVAQPEGLEAWLEVWSSALFALPPPPATSLAPAPPPAFPVYPRLEEARAPDSRTWMTPGKEVGPDLSLPSADPVFDVRVLRGFREPPPVRPLAGEVAGYVMDVLWSDADGERRLDQLNGVDQPPWRDDQSWEARFSVTLGPQGWVRDYFMTRSTESRERNLTLMRVIMAMQVPGGEENQSGTIIVRYRPVWTSGPGGLEPDEEGA